MNTEPIIIEEELDAPVEKVWKALTNRNEISEWFFPLDEFEPEIGFIFTFYAGGEEEKYMHICKVKDVVPNRRLSYSWKYEDVEGYSNVTYELFSEREKTFIKLIHEGIDTFPQDKPEFSRESFEKGWNDIIGIYLKEYVQNI